MNMTWKFQKASNKFIFWGVAWMCPRTGGHLLASVLDEVSDAVTCKTHQRKLLQLFLLL